MSLEHTQKDVDDWAKQFTPPYWEALQQLGKLSEELGEVAREINNLYGPQQRLSREKAKDNLGMELTDVIFTACCIANRHNINLQEKWENMMKERRYTNNANKYMPNK